MHTKEDLEARIIELEADYEAASHLANSTSIAWREAIRTISEQETALRVYAHEMNWREIQSIDPDDTTWVWCGPPLKKHPNTWAKEAIKR
jgi:hypothetical protein